MKLTSEALKQLVVFSLFLTVSGFEQHMEGWLLKCRLNFSKGEIIVLKMLLQYAICVPLVCHGEIGRILESVRREDDCFGISRATFKRMRRRADTFGILSAMKQREKMADAIVIYMSFIPIQTLSNPGWQLALPCSDP